MNKFRLFWYNIITSPATPASVLLFGNVMLYKPALIYQGNSTFFYYSLFQTILPLFPILVLLIGIFAYPAIGVENRFRKGYVTWINVVAILAWVNSTFLFQSEGVLDGKTFKLDTGVYESVINLGILVVLATIVVWLSLHYSKLVRKFLVFINFGLIATVIVALVLDPNSWRSNVGAEKFTSFSTSRNVLVILLDTFQSDFLEVLLEKHPDLASKFDGFTYFPNAVGSAATTYLAVPTLMSGELYRPEKSISEFYETGVVRHSFVTKHVANGFDGFLLNPVGRYCPQGTKCVSDVELLNGVMRSALLQSAGVVDFSMLRTVPAMAKRFIYNDGEWLTYRFVSEMFDIRVGDSLGTRSLADNEILEKLASGITLESTKPTIKFLHLLNTHPPAQVQDDCKFITGKEWNRTNAINQAECATRKVVKVLESLNSSGIYDNTMIVLLADHGAGLSRNGFFNAGAFASPLLMVKPFKTKGALIKSDLNVGLMDLPKTICSMTKVCIYEAGVSLFGSDAKLQRQFQFLLYSWKPYYKWGDVIPIDGHYEISGSPTNPVNWKRVFSEPLSITQAIEFAKSDPLDNYGFGWGEFETTASQNLRWSLGGYSDLYLSLHPSLNATVKLSVVTHPANEGQMLSIFVNGVFVTELPISASKFTTQEFVIPGKLINTSPVHIQFNFSKWNPPGSTDVRPLAVLFDKLIVNQQN